MSNLLKMPIKWEEDRVVKRTPHGDMVEFEWVKKLCELDTMEYSDYKPWLEFQVVRIKKIED